MHVGLAESITEYILLLKFLLFMAPGSYDNHTENAQLRALASQAILYPTYPIKVSSN